ncbi:MULTISPECIES: hypothetical protein [Kordiimonas]|jgi:hypothetical protein|nr:hypothetical protein [Kordiimonas sp. UBA4487]
MDFTSPRFGRRFLFEPLAYGAIYLGLMAFRLKGRGRKRVKAA